MLFYNVGLRNGSKIYRAFAYNLYIHLHECSQKQKIGNQFSEKLKPNYGFPQRFIGYAEDAVIIVESSNTNGTFFIA